MRMTTLFNQRSLGVRAAHASALCLLALAAALLQAREARAQWTTPDAQGNISTTNTGNVGVGTSAPTSKLEVKGATSDATASALKVTDSSGRGLFFINNSGQATIGAGLAWNTLAVVTPTGTRGGVSIVGDGNEWVYSDLYMTPASTTGIATGKPTNFGFSFMKNNSAYGGDATGPSFALVSHRQGGGMFVPFIVNPSGNVILAGASGATNGNVGIGTNTPAAKLDVNGDIRVSGNFNTTGTITGGNISAKYQDVAEWVPTKQQLSAGTVVVLDTRHSNHVAASANAYDTRVAGVISAQPGISLGEAGEGKVLVATTGRVKVKVDATRAPIQIGDLIVTSGEMGMAMRSEPVSVGGVSMHRPGTLIGKALESLEKGTGEILVLLSLQ